MKDLMVKAWGYVPNKSQVLMTAVIVCVILAILGGSAVWFGGNVVIYKGETAFETTMRHMHQWSEHDNETNIAQTAVLAMLPEYIVGAARLQKLQDDMAKHERNKLQYMDKDGNFLSDFYEETYREGRKKLQIEIELQKTDTDSDNSFYTGKIEFAQRDR